MSGVCRHGSLRRSCEICDLEEMVKELEASLTEVELERQDWARRFQLNGVTPWEWMSRAEKAEDALATARAKERERCAKVAETWSWHGAQNATQLAETEFYRGHIARTIRALRDEEEK